jgi:nicotinamidase-related amidase
MKLLVVVDMQNDFIDGVLGTPEAQAIVPTVAEKVRKHAEGGEPILYTKDTHYDWYLQSQEGRKLPVPHCIYGTKGHQLHPDIHISGSYYADKLTFGLADIGEVVEHIARDRDVVIDEIELVGLCTDICVISNAMLLKAYFPEMSIRVDSSCCAGVTPESHKNALNAMKMCQIEII